MPMNTTWLGRLLQSPSRMASNLVDESRAPAGNVGQAALPVAQKRHPSGNPPWLETQTADGLGWECQRFEAEAIGGGDSSLWCIPWPELRCSLGAADRISAVSLLLRLQAAQLPELGRNIDLFKPAGPPLA